MGGAGFHTVLTVLFFIAFIVMVVWVWLPRRKKHYDDAARMPLDDDASRHDTRSGTDDEEKRR